jgi:hypothetical protein
MEQILFGKLTVAELGKKSSPFMEIEYSFNAIFEVLKAI